MRSELSDGSHRPSAYCGWCKRECEPRRVIGPGIFCNLCGGYLGANVETVMSVRPKPRSIAEQPPEPEIQQLELAHG